MSGGFVGRLKAIPENLRNLVTTFKDDGAVDTVIEGGKLFARSNREATKTLGEGVKR